MAEQGFVVEVVYARADVQSLVSVLVPAGAVLRDAVQRSGLAEHYPELDLDRLDAGIFGKPAAPDTPLRPGDRVELYRPLLANPPEMRRQRAQRQRR